MVRAKKIIVLAAIAIIAVCGYVPVNFADPVIPWKFIVVGDSRGSDNGVNSGIVRELAAGIESEKPEFVLFPGDLVSGSSSYSALKSQLTYWRSLFQEPLAAAGIEVYAIRGNHEVTPGETSSRQAWNETFSGAYAFPDNGPPGEKNMTFSFSFRNALFIGLDVYGNHPHRVNQTWLNEQLSRNTLPFVFVLAHEPAYAMTGADAHQDCLAAYKTERNAFAASITNGVASAYFCGHDHWYNHSRAALTGSTTFHQYIMGTGGAPLRTRSGGYAESNVTGGPTIPNYGYLVVEVTGDKTVLTFKERTGTATFAAKDVFTLAAPATAVAPPPGDTSDGTNVTPPPPPGPTTPTDTETASIPEPLPETVEIPPTNIPPVPAPWPTDRIVVYPNPYQPGSRTRFDRAGGMVFSNLADNSTIRIFSLTGELVFEGKEDNGDGTYEWPAENNAGNRVASGVYIFCVVPPSGKKETGKIAVIR